MQQPGRVLVVTDDERGVVDDRHVGVDHGVTSAGAADGEGAEGDALAGPHGGPVPVEQIRRLRVGEQCRVGVRVEEGGQSRGVGVVGVLVGHEDRVETGEAFESVREVSGVEEDLRAEMLDEEAGVAEMGQSHGSSMPLFGLSLVVSRIVPAVPRWRNEAGDIVA